MSDTRPGTMKRKRNTQMRYLRNCARRSRSRPEARRESRRWLQGIGGERPDLPDRLYEETTNLTLSPDNFLVVTEDSNCAQIRRALVFLASSLSILNFPFVVNLFCILMTLTRGGRNCALSAQSRMEKIASRP